MAEVLVSPGISISETDKSFIAGRPLVAGAAIVGPTVTGPVMVPTKVTSYADYMRKFGSTFKMEKEVNGITMDMEQEFLTSMAAKSYFEQGGDSLLVVRVADMSEWAPAQSTNIKASGSSAVPFRLETLAEGAILNSAGSENFVPFEEEADVDERKDGSLISGSADNLRWEISNVDEETGTFALTIRRGDDAARDQVVLESFINLSMDPNNPNYIAKIIGDQKSVLMYDDAGLPYIDVQGNYPNLSNYIRVIDVIPLVNYQWVGDGTNNPEYVNYLPKEQEGAFFGGKGAIQTIIPAEVEKPVLEMELVQKKDENGEPVVDEEGNPVMEEQPKKDENGEFIQKENEDGTPMTETVIEEFSADFFQDITENSRFPQGVPTDLYEDAIALLENMDEYKVNILSAPGLMGIGAQSRIDQLISTAELRGDCIAVVDLVGFGQNTKGTAQAAQKCNSSYAATYWPWLQMYSATGRLEWVPASVVIPGVYAFTDKAAAPWFAPAGMTRGGLQGVVQTERKLTKAHRDTLYQKNVNPIATFPGSGIVIFGQKTLQKKASALDRVNVRRLLIELKDKVRTMASGLLFEQNTLALRNSFRAQLEPYMESVVQRQGLYAFNIDLESLNTADVIDRNEFRCRIFIQPTKTIEFIYIDFTVTATGVEFNN